MMPTIFEKTMFWLAVLVSLIIAPPSSFATTSDEYLLENAVKFSHEVKVFEKTIGVNPSNILTKSIKSLPPKSALLIYMQKRGTISIEPEVHLQFYFPAAESEITINESYTHNKIFSVFYRQSDETAAEDMPINLAFAKSSLVWQAEIIIHEDLHANTKHLWGSENTESIVTPLAYIVVLKFFESKNDTENARIALAGINYQLAFSRELMNVAKTAQVTFEQIPYPDAQKEIFKYLFSQPTYSADFQWRAKTSAPENILEAIISHDLYYWRYFERIIRLYEKGPDIQTLIADLKTAPANTNELEKYFEILEKKYSAAATK